MASEQSAASYAMAKQRFDVGGISELSLLDVVRFVPALRLVAMFLRLWHRAV